MGLINETAQSYYDSSSLQKYGGYQFTSLEQIINQFIIAYVGEDNIIPKVKRTTVQFHAMRALQELSFDTLKSVKSIEVEVPPSLSVILPQDYVNYVKIAISDDVGIERILYPTSKTSNPFPIKQNSDGTYDFDLDDDGLVDSPALKHQNTIYKPIDTIAINGTTAQLGQYLVASQTQSVGGASKLIDDNTSDLKVGMFVISPHFPHGTKITAITAGVALGTNGGEITFDKTSLNTTAIINGELIFSKDLVETSDTYRKFKSNASQNNIVSTNTNSYEDNQFFTNEGNRYGIDPQHAQANGSYFIDELQGRIYFTSAISGKTIILKYISDGLGTDEEMQVHKFAEEAMYKCIAYAIMSTRANVQEYIVRRFQKDKFAAVRKAKLRLSNLKLEELTQILRGKSKQIKH